MGIAVLVFLVAMAVLAPLIGADTRDGRDWHEPEGSSWRWR